MCGLDSVSTPFCLASFALALTNLVEPRAAAVGALTVFNSSLTPRLRVDGAHLPHYVHIYAHAAGDSHRAPVSVHRADDKAREFDPAVSSRWRPANDSSTKAFDPADGTLFDAATRRFKEDIRIHRLDAQRCAAIGCSL